MRESFDVTTKVLADWKAESAREQRNGSADRHDHLEAPRLLGPCGLQERFRRDAVPDARGGDSPRLGRSWRVAAYAAAALAIVAVGAGTWAARRAIDRSDSRADVARTEASRAMERIATLESAQRELMAQLGSKDRDALLLSRRGEQRSADLSALESAHQASLAKLEEMDRNMRGIEEELASARAETAGLRNERDRLSANLKDSEKTTTQLTAQVGRLTRLERQLRDLTWRAQEQQDAIQRQEMLLSTDDEIRNLVVARNLHIIDINDVDSNGKPKPTFGRVFYTEGKSLVFYAFDMGLLAKTVKAGALHAWGQHTQHKGAPASLGIFNEDTKSQNRWILKFENPEVLGRIDSVYVTVEPSGSKAPHGAQVLFAYLGTPPNHP
jgi:hypothetical protein